MQAIRILLAENDRDYRESLRGFLELEGFRVREAAGPAEARAALEDGRLDLVLADLRLADDDDESDLSGLELASAAREARVPCLILTAYPTVEVIRLALRVLGEEPLANDFLQKGDGPRAVAAAIREMRGFSILHLSDLHLRAAGDGGSIFDLERASEAFLADVIALPGLALDPVGAVVVSGDLANRCQPESFRMARDFLERVARKLALPLERFVLAPGNHDVDRAKARAVPDSPAAMRAGDPAWFDKFEPFLAFTRDFYGEPAFTRGRLYRTFVFDDRVALAAFNSCLVEGDAAALCRACQDGRGKEHYHGWIDGAQVREAGAELDRAGWKGTRIGVFHHHVAPPGARTGPEGCQGDHLWSYHDEDQLLKFALYDSGFRIVLHGHQHKAGLNQPGTLGAGIPCHFGSGTFWLTSRDEGATANYLVLGLSPIHGRSRVLMRRYHPSTPDRRGHWAADDLIQPDGVVPLPETVIPAANPRLPAGRARGGGRT